MDWKSTPCETPDLAELVLFATISWVSLTLINGLIKPGTSVRLLHAQGAATNPWQCFSIAAQGWGCSPAPPTQTSSLLPALFISLSSCLSSYLEALWDTNSIDLYVQPPRTRRVQVLSPNNK